MIDSDSETVKNAESEDAKGNDNSDSADDGDDRTSVSLYDYNTELEIRQQLKNQKNDNNNLRSIQNSFDDFLSNKNSNNNQQNSDNKNKFNTNNNDEEFLDLQRSRSVVTPLDINFGPQLIGN